MSPLLIVLLVILVLALSGGWGYRRYYPEGGWGFPGIGLILAVLLVLLLFGGPRW